MLTSTKGVKDHSSNLIATKEISIRVKMENKTVETSDDAES